MDLRFSPHASNRDTHTYWHLLQQLLSTQWSLQAVILVRSTISALSQRPLLSWRFTHFDIFCTLADLVLSRPSAIHWLLSCLVGKNIHRLILFEWVMLFKKQAVNLLIGNHIHRVNVIKGSLYSQVYSMSCWGEKRYQALPIFLYCKWRKGGSGLGKRWCMSLFPSHSVQYNIMEVHV